MGNLNFNTKLLEKEACESDFDFLPQLFALLKTQKSWWRHQECPYACGNFHACAFTRFQKPQQLGRARIAERARRLSSAQRAGPDLSGQRCCKLRLKLLLIFVVLVLGKEDLHLKAVKRSVELITTKRLVCKYGHLLVEPPSRVFYTVSVSACLFVSERFFLVSTSPFTLSHGRQNRRSSFCSGRGDNLVTIARFGKPSFANMHHCVYGIAGALRKPDIACPHPDVSTG